ncbi:MAG: MFS transporter [Chloroflexi bacterium]|nr:MFS transporter [Chloroflexota bacterium]
MSSESTVMTIEEAIDQIGIGRFQHKLLVIAGLGWAADAMEVSIVAFVLPSIIAQWALSPLQASGIGTAIFVGMLIGAWFWGRLSDRIGRKFGFQVTILIDSVFGFLSALSPNYLFLLITRTITGFGVGGTLPVDYSIFAEYLPTKDRGRWLVLLESFWALGVIVVAGLAWLIIPRFDFGWRLLLALSAVPGVLIFFIRRYVPESPRYLLIDGREEEARQVLQQVAAENGVSLHIDRLKAQPRNESVNVRTLLKAPFLRTTLMLWVAWFAISFGYYGTLIWLPGIFFERGFDFVRTYQNTFILALAQLPGYFSAAYLVERWGRKRTLTIYLLFSGAFTFVFALVNDLPLIVTAASLMTFFTLGAWGVLYAYTPELYPTEIRATGMGAASGMTRVAGAIAPIIAGFLLPLSLVAPLALFAVAFLVGAGAVFFFGQETQNVPLEETVKADPQPSPAR